MSTDLRQFINQRLATAGLLVKHLPVASIVVTVGPPPSYVINYKPGATPAQQAEAAALVATLDWGTSYPDGMLNSADRAALWEHDFLTVIANTQSPPDLHNNVAAAVSSSYILMSAAARQGFWATVRTFINGISNAGAFTTGIRDACLAITPTDPDPDITLPSTLTLTL